MTFPFFRKKGSLLKTRVLIIGGGATGTGLARDFALRGVPCILVDQEDINAGASGANHGLLHSGARYVSTDPESAAECRDESATLKKTASHCIEDTGGLFVAVEGDDEKFIADFPGYCSRCGISAKATDIKEARSMETALSEKVIAAFEVSDASVDPFKLVLENITQARNLGATFLRGTKVVGFKKRKGRISSVHLVNVQTGENLVIEAEQVVNASGVWAGEIAALAGDSIDMIYSKGSLLITHSRITGRVINRLRPPGDADILVPGGTVSIVGTTSARVDALDDIRPTAAEVDLIVDEGAAMLPMLESVRYIRVYSGVRPLLGTQSGADDRNVSRGFDLVDHAGKGIENFVTITGGKLTTYRLMAEQTADLVCSRLGVTAPCQTRTEPLPSAHAWKWTVPGIPSKAWLKDHKPDDLLLCECEMVPQSAVDSIVSAMDTHKRQLDLNAIGKRSRIGKGACQGSLCSIRVLAYLYDRGYLQSDQGIPHLRKFLNERWKGQRVLLWDMPLIQSELKEAIHCGLFGLEN
jgi:glycerol-3-phosphate dehydrogenase